MRRRLPALFWAIILVLSSVPGYSQSSGAGPTIPYFVIGDDGERTWVSYLTLINKRDTEARVVSYGILDEYYNVLRIPVDEYVSNNSLTSTVRKYISRNQDDPIDSIPPNGTRRYRMVGGAALQRGFGVFVVKGTVFNNVWDADVEVQLTIQSLNSSGVVDSSVTVMGIPSSTNPRTFVMPIVTSHTIMSGVAIAMSGAVTLTGYRPQMEALLTLRDEKGVVFDRPVSIFFRTGEKNLIAKLIHEIFPAMPKDFSSGSLEVELKNFGEIKTTGWVMGLRLDVAGNNGELRVSNLTAAIKLK